MKLLFCFKRQNLLHFLYLFNWVKPYVHYINARASVFGVKPISNLDAFKMSYYKAVPQRALSHFVQRVRNYQDQHTSTSEKEKLLYYMQHLLSHSIEALERVLEAAQANIEVTSPFKPEVTLRRVDTLVRYRNILSAIAGQLAERYGKKDESVFM